MKIHPAVAHFFHAHKRTERHDVILLVAFLNFTKAPKKAEVSSTHSSSRQ